MNLFAKRSFAKSRMATIVVAGLLAFAFCLSPLEASAANRLALVIGNDAYENISSLQKAVNDARSIGDTLEELGFAVTRAENVSRREMNRVLQEFTQSVEAGDSAMFFYAGHGVEIEGLNYLLPVDVPDASPGQADFIRNESLSLDDVLARLREREPRLNLVVLDACRNNPFGRTGTRSLGAGTGLARIAAPEGTFVMYSADIGEAALDRLGDDDRNPNSVFTRTLIPLMRTPGMDLVDTAREVRRRVRDLASTISHQQTPSYYDAVLGDFYFAGQDGGRTPVPPQSPGKNDGPDGEEQRDANNDAGNGVTSRSTERPERALLLTGGEKDSIRLWDAEAGRLITELQGEKIVPSSIRFADGGKSVLVATRGGVLFSYSVPDLKKKNALYPGYAVSSMAQADDGTLLIGGENGMLAAIDPETFKTRWQVRAHGSIISPIIVNEADRTLLTASDDGTVAVADLATGAVLKRASTLQGKSITDIQLITDNTLVAAHEDGTIAYIDLAGNRVLSAFRGNKGWISSVGLSPGKTGFVTAGVDGNLSFWTVGAQLPDKTLAGHTDVASVAKFVHTSQGDRMVSAGFDGLVRVWDEQGNAILTEMDHGSAILFFDRVNAR